VPFAYYFQFIARYKAKRKANRLPLAIHQLLAKKVAGGDWGLRGWMESEQRNIK
jgi:hypothetical protein